MMRDTIRASIRQSIQWGWRLLALGRPPAGVRVLMYHSVDDSGSILSVSPQRLRAQLRWLRDHGVRALTGREFIDRYNGHAGTECEVLITFDDGYANLLTHAAPILAEFAVPATVFVSCDLMGGIIDAFRRDRQVMQDRRAGKAIGAERIDQAIEVCSSQRVLTWDEAARLRDFGVEVQSHSATHDFLTRLDDQTLVANLTRSRQQIADHLGMVPKLIAYPYGDCDARVAAVAGRCGFAVGMLAEPLCPPGDPMRIGRRGIYDATSPDDFAFILSAAADLDLRMRRAVARAPAH
jgi:peptidoglycan/xylan/chitin deacetylase (PgdA/CDA1 family)